MRKMDKATGTSVMYMRVCAPKTGTVQKVLTEKPELLKRIDLILYQPKGGDKAKQKGAQSPQTMESILPSIMQVGTCPATLRHIELLCADLHLEMCCWVETLI